MTLSASLIFLSLESRLGCVWGKMELFKSKCQNYKMCNCVSMKGDPVPMEDHAHLKQDSLAERCDKPLQAWKTDRWDNPLWTIVKLHGLPGSTTATEEEQKILAMDVKKSWRACFIFSRTWVSIKCHTVWVGYGINTLSDWVGSKHPSWSHHMADKLAFINLPSWMWCYSI